MNLQKFTEKAQEAVVAAKQLAEEMQQQEIGMEHMLIALGEQKDGVVPRLLRLREWTPRRSTRRCGERLTRARRCTGRVRSTSAGG